MGEEHMKREYWVKRFNAVKTGKMTSRAVKVDKVVRFDHRVYVLKGDTVLLTDPKAWDQAVVNLQFQYSFAWMLDRVVDVVVKFGLWTKEDKQKWEAFKKQETVRQEIRDLQREIKQRETRLQRLQEQQAADRESA